MKNRRPGRFFYLCLSAGVVFTPAGSFCKSLATENTAQERRQIADRPPAPKPESSRPVPKREPSDVKKITNEAPRVHSNMTKKDFRFYVKIVQEGREISVQDGGLARIKRAPFAFRFPLISYRADYDESQKKSPLYGVMLAAAFAPGDVEITPGKSRADHQVFGFSRAMAASKTGYQDLRIESGGFHYLIYDPQNAEDSRVRKVSRLLGDVYEVEWKVKSFFWKQKLPVEEIPGDLYVTIFFDRNDDDIFDEGEFIRFQLLFQD